MPSRLFACFVLSVALRLSMLTVNDAIASSMVHRHKHHNSNHHRHDGSQHGTHHASSNNNNSHNSASHYMQNTHYERWRTPHHASLLHPNKTSAMHNSISTQTNRSVNNGDGSIVAIAAAAPNAITSTSTQRTADTATATAAPIKSQKLSLINSHSVYNRFGGDIFNADASKRWPVMVATDNARRIDTANWRINFNPIVTTASPNGIGHRVIFNDQRIFTKPHTQRG